MTETISAPVDATVRAVGRGMALGGEAVYAPAEGPVIFVPRGAPGDVAAIAVTGARQGVRRGRLAEVVQPGPGRVEPPCQFFRAGCGGCQWQQLDDATQLAEKQTLLRETLRRLGKLDPLPLLEPVAAPDSWHYRSAIQLHIDADGRPAYAAAHSHDLIPVDDCPIAHPLLGRLLGALAAPLPRAILRDHVAAIRGLSARVCRADDADALMLVVESVGGRPRSTERLAAALREVLPELASVWLRLLPPEGAGRRRQARWDLLYGTEALAQDVEDRRFYVGPRSFFQVNPAQTGALVRLVRAAVRAAQPRLLVDLFSGVGLFALSAADLAEDVVGVEAEPEAVALARRAAEEAATQRGRGGRESAVRFLCAAAEEIEEADLRQADVVILDPPRAGLSAPLTDHLIAAAPPTLLYVSCEPSTLARDLRRFTGAGWELASVQLIDLFPQTFHIESVAVLRRGA